VERTKSGRQQVRSVVTDVELLGAPFRATVYFGRVRGRMVCVGLDLRGFTSTDKQTNVKPLDGWDELNSPRLRSLPIATVVEEARRSQIAVDLLPLVSYPLGSPPPTADEIAADQAILQRTYEAAVAATPTGRRGRRPVLSDDDLRDVVALAYNGGGRKPVQAVQGALQAYGMPGAGEHNEVTIDQARKNVKRARELGFIDPPVKKGKP
jgi:hypothetical protein